MTCTGDWATHHNACDCSEAARAEELERLLTSNGSLRLRAVAAERQREACAARLTALLERRGATAVWVDEHDMLLTPLVTDGAGNGGES